MTPSQIITQDVQQLGGDADVMLRKINKLVQAKAAILLQQNDSILLLINIAKGAVEIHLFTADNPVSLTKSMEVFLQKIKSSDVKKVYIDDTNSKLLDAAEKAGWDLQKSNMPNYAAMVTVGNK